MKLKKILIAALVVPLAFTACDKSDEADNSREQVKIVATIGVPTGNQTKASFENDGSGAFEAGDEYSLSFWSPTLGMGAIFPYEIGKTTLYWDEVYHDDNPVDFTAWYPVYSFSGIFIQRYKVADAATEAAKDLLMAPTVTVAVHNPVNLQFKHVMHKLTIILSADFYSAAELNNAVITLKNLKSDAMVDFENGTVDETAASGTDPYPQKQGAAANFIVAPQNGLTAGTDLVKIEVAGKTYMYKVPDNLTVLESGKQLSLTLKLKKGDGVTGDIYIGEDFNPGGGHDG
ncbi:MAG: fimbrillin family protein [Prevotella sp.]|jgi:hypothetical protein|nr:fimbrillin family protein [Prevotella sp.]